MKTFLKFILFCLLILGAGWLGYRVGVLVGEENILKTPPAQIVNQEGELIEADFSVFWEAWRQLERHFLETEKIDYQKMVYGAAEGMVKSLGDPYTAFFSPKETDEFNEELSGKYEGVGMYVDIRDEQVTIVSPITGTPADKAGLKAGDVIVKVDGAFTADLSIEEAVRLIKGQEGTFVELLIQRQGWTEFKEFKVQRAKIKIPTLEWEVVDNEIALVSMYQFNQILTNEFNKAALGILNSGIKKIILDLRNNPGGYLEVSQNLAGWFLEKGKVVVWQETRDEEEPREAYKSGGPGALKDFGIVVLINQGSASAAEILAGALRDHLGTKLVGEKSFGKGSVQEQINLADGSSLKVTIAKWLTPDGNLIDGEGLAPDIEVEMPPEEELEIGEDPQLEKAIEILKNL